VRVLVLRAAGTNCDRETLRAFDLAGAKAEARHVNELLARPEMLETYDGVVIPGGFSYGDDIAGGRVLAAEWRHHLLEATQRFLARGGLLLGICNGFQVLLQTGLLPGPASAGRKATLTHNDSHRYIDRWVELEAVSDRCPFVRRGATYAFPIAHAEGKFVAGPEELARLEENGQVVFRYRKNPNGSMHDIAGICDETGRVLGLMPHPERHMEPWHHPAWTKRGLAEKTDGRRFFEALVSTTPRSRPPAASRG